MDEKDPTSRTPSAPYVNRGLILLGAAVTLAIFLAGTFVLWQDRQEAWHQAETSSRNLLLALRRDLARNFELLDLSLQGAAEAVSEPGIDAVSPGIYRHALFDRSASTEDIASFVIINKNGWISHDANNALPPHVYLGDRAYFRAHLNDPDLGAYFSNVYRSRLRGGAPTVALSRRLNTPDGKFAGVVLGTIATEYFHRLFKNLDLGEHGSLTLLTTSGRVVDRKPFREEDIDRDLSASPIVQKTLIDDEGQFIGRSPIDGLDRLITFARVTGMPLVVTVNLSVGDIYAGWWQRAAISLSVLLLLCTATISLTLLFYREVRRRARAEGLLLESTRQLSLIAATDGLTGLGNRRTMETEIAREWRRAIRTSSPLALLMVDVDHFKLYNDRYGHPEGDAVLRTVAKCLKDNILRSTDAISRYGGEEFVILLGETEAAGALATAERVRNGVEQLQISHGGAPSGKLSISVGVSVAYPTLRNSADGLLKAADLALYEAKRSGRNCVRLSLSAPEQVLPLAMSGSPA